MANRPNFNSIKVDGFEREIREVQHTKYLGVTIDQNLKWKQHVARLTSNIRKLIRKFYIIREILNEHLLICVYRALVESLLRYAIIVWGSLYENALKPLRTVQNYILRIIFRKDKMSPTYQLYSDKIPSTRCLFVLSVCSYMYQNPTIVGEHVSHSYSTRSNVVRNLQIPNSTTNLNLRSIEYLGVKIYNILPVELRVMTVNKKKIMHNCRVFICNNFDTFSSLF